MEYKPQTSRSWSLRRHVLEKQLRRIAGQRILRIIAQKPRGKQDSLGRTLIQNSYLRDIYTTHAQKRQILFW